MNGYLNNLTMRTLNQGNRIEPRLPALFEPSALESGAQGLEKFATYEEAAIVSETARPRVEGNEPISVEPSSHDPAVTKLEIEDGVVTPRSTRVEAGEDPELRFERQQEAHSEQPEDPVETLTVRATLKPRKQSVETVTPQEVDDSVVETAPIFNEVESPTSADTRSADSSPARASSSASSPAASSNRKARRLQIQPAPEEQSDPFERQLASANDGIVRPQIQTRETESLVSHAKETRPNTEELISESPVQERPEELRAAKAFAARVNPIPANWRDARQQQWRRRQQPGPIEAEPSINVTIGRIEVRAVTADNHKTTSPRRSESPVMPLEDYLRKQRRGSDR